MSLVRAFLLIAVGIGSAPTTVSPATGQNSPARIRLEGYARLADVISGGFRHGNCVRIRVGDRTYFNNLDDGPETAGLYVVALYDRKVLLQEQYNTFGSRVASGRFAADIDRLPRGAFVVIAAKDEPTRQFDSAAQKALRGIGARIGLENQAFRTSYLCLGLKGLPRGEAIEKLGLERLEHIGADVNLAKRFALPGPHEGLMIGETEVLYYVPSTYDPRNARYLFTIHGAGDWHRPGALTLIAQFKKTAENHNLILIAPSFDAIFRRPLDSDRDLDGRGRLRDRGVVRDWHLWGFTKLVNRHNGNRSDLKLLEIHEYFNERLLRRKQFLLYGHSGGGQFVARFLMFHAGVVEKAVISSAGSYAFPDRSRDFPYGLRMDDLAVTFGAQVLAESLQLSAKEQDARLNQLLDLRVYVLAGDRENVADGQPERSWQGKHVLDRAHRFVGALKLEDRRLKELGARSKQKPFGVELYVMRGVGHDSAAAAKAAIELLFPSR